MGIDPDAYMAGAIPSLNRGGSWRMDEPHPHGSQYHSVHPDSVPGRGGSIFPRPSQIVPPPPPVSSTHANGDGNGNGVMNLCLNMGNRGNFHPFHSQMTMGGHPFMSGMPSPPVRGVQSQSGSRKAGSVRPTLVLGGAGMGSQRGDGSGKSTISHVPSVRSVNHPGWASLPPTGQGHNHNANASTRTRSSPSSPTTPSSANFIAGQATSQYGLKAAGKVTVKPLVLSPGAMEAMEPTWDWESATHDNLIPTPKMKGMTTEPDYFSIQHRGSPTIAYAAHTPGTPRTPHTPFEAGFESLPPPPRPAPGSPRARADSHRSQIHPPHHRPPPTRRHTHDRFSPDREPPLERERERERKPSGTRAMARVDSKSLGRARVRSGSGLRRSTMDSEADGESYYAPSKTYAHTLDDRSRRSPSSIATSTNTSFAPSTTPTNLTASLEKSRPGHTRRSTSVLPSSPLASSQSSFTERRFKDRPHPALSTINSTIVFTQTAPSSPTTSSRHQRQPSLDMRSLNDALPQTAPLQAPSSHGYIPPTSEDEYDPFAAHPSPAPRPTPSTSPSQAQSQTKPKPTGAGLKHVTPDSYRPPGFPKATKQLAWNRDGPAMKTHGVAWLREAEVDQLPGGPAGPRYIQARPPMSAIQSGGSWWDSAA